jgi:hypothetical protein
MFWPFKSKMPCFAVSGYRLDAPISDLPGLVELSPVETAALNLTLQFEGERIFHAPPALFVGRSWDTILGTVDGQIYKIALQLAGLSKNDVGIPEREVLAYITRQQGRAPKSDSPVLVWDAADGNIVFHDVRLESGEIFLNFFLTSRAIRSFQPQRQHPAPCHQFRNEGNTK